MASTSIARKGPANERDQDGPHIARARGSFIYDTAGRKFIDFTAGWCVGNLGWGRKEIETAIRRFDGPAYVNPSYVYKPWNELAKGLADIAPGRLNQVFRATGGSEAVDIALQAAMLHTRRSKLVSIEGAYHGNTIAGRSIADSAEKFPRLLAGCLTVKPPLDAGRLDRVETLLKKRDVAAFIMEPIICNLGVVIPAPEFMRGLRTLCRRYRTLLIIDEVATGFGRTGKMFGCECFDLAPDIMCVAKAITGGYAPMGATFTTVKVARAMQKIGAYSTYGWHPLSVAAALANLAYWKRHQSAVLQNVAAVGEFMQHRLSDMPFKRPAEIRAKGLAIGVELGDEDYVSKIQERCRSKGLLVAAEGTALTIFPPLTIERAIAEDGLTRMERCL